MEIRNQIWSILLYPELIQISFNPCFGGNQKSNVHMGNEENKMITSFNPCFGGNQKSNEREGSNNR